MKWYSSHRDRGISKFDFIEMGAFDENLLRGNDSRSWCREEVLRRVWHGRPALVPECDGTVRRGDGVRAAFRDADHCRGRSVLLLRLLHIRTNALCLISENSQLRQKARNYPSPLPKYERMGEKKTRPMRMK